MRIFHFVIVFQWQTATGSRAIADIDGTYTAAPGATRQDAYRAIRDKFRRAGGPVPPNAAPVFFSLDPNDLGV